MSGCPPPAAPVDPSGYGLLRRRSLGRVLVAAGAVPAVCGGLIAAIGLERALTMWNDQMALLPWGLSRILGITVYLGIPESLPVYACSFGLVLVLGGGVLLKVPAGSRVPGQ